MSLAIIESRAQVGVDSPRVFVEVQLSRGLPAFNIVGMAETAVKESRERVRAAIINAQFEFPQKRISVNLAPADLPKEGGRYDLAIAIGLLAASGQIPGASIKNRVFLGELGLSGELRNIPGALNAALSVADCDATLVLPEHSAQLAALAAGGQVESAASLLQVAHALIHDDPLDQPAAPPWQETDNYPDLADVIGQEFPKTALITAAAGGHSLLMLGSPGSGKSMLAHRITGILPPLNRRQALETAAIYSLLDANVDPQQVLKTPYRAPHHGASGAALIGGGTNPRPGEISKAHNGILFLDELTEFDRRALDLLREPLESGFVNISRAHAQVTYPCKFQLIAAANPCRCGYFGDPSNACRCTPQQIQNYLSKLSGPLLDRIDIQIPVFGLNHPELVGRKPGTTGHASKPVREKVIRAQSHQHDRQGCLNCDLDAKQLERWCPLDQEGNRLMERVFTEMQLSARSYHRILKVSRTIADLEDSEAIKIEHLSTAVKMRCLDLQSRRMGWR